MSWEDHIKSLTDTKNVKDAAIIEYASSSFCGVSPGFNLTNHSVELEDEKGAKHSAIVDELKILQQLVDNKGIVPSPPGIWLNKVKYHLIKWDDELRVAYLKCPTGGATVMRTNIVIIVGTWDKDQNKGAGNCNLAITTLGETFLGVGY